MSPLPAADLRAAGEALYGERWQTPLASAIGLSSTRRLREYLERGQAPAWVRDEIKKLMAARRNAIALAEKKMAPSR